MADDLMRYDQMTEDASRQVVRKSLEHVAAHGLPGEHHFYIHFDTGFPGVEIPDSLKSQYPEEMTVVIQHQFWDLIVREDYFEIDLTFSNVPQHLRIPFNAIRGFYDPSVNFSLQFVLASAARPPQGIADESDAAETTGRDQAQRLQVGETESHENIVNLETFRKK